MQWKAGERSLENCVVPGKASPNPQPPAHLRAVLNTWGGVSVEGLFRKGKFCTGNILHLSQKIKGQIPHLLNLEWIGRKYFQCRLCAQSGPGEGCQKKQTKKNGQKRGKGGNGWWCLQLPGERVGRQQAKQGKRGRGPRVGKRNCKEGSDDRWPHGIAGCRERGNAWWRPWKKKQPRDRDRGGAAVGAASGRRGTGTREVRKHSPMGSANRSLWRGEPWVNHGEPDHGKFGKYLGHQDSREAFVG